MTALKVVSLVSGLVIAPVCQAGETLELIRAPDAALAAAADGSFLPNTMPAKVGGTQVFAYGSGGYDFSRRGPLTDSAVEVRVWGPFSLRAQATYSNDTDRERPSIAGRVQVLRQDAHGVDGSVTVFFKTEGFTESEGEIETFASIGRRFERLTALGNLVYGQDPEGNERDGEVRAAAFRQLGRLIVGLDSRARFAIGTQHGRAQTTEPKFDFAGGPLGTFAAGPVAVFAEMGPSAFALAGGPTHVGVAGLVGLGAAF